MEYGNKNQLTDEEIIELFFARNESAVKETNRKYGKYCHKIANNILQNREDSEECVNDTWYQAWRSIPPTHPQYFQMFLAKIVRNISFDKYRAKNRIKRGTGEIALVLEELDECIAGQQDVESAYIAEELKDCIQNFVDTLPDREAKIFIHRYFFVDSVSVIARNQHLSANHVSVILGRSRKKLKKVLEKEGYLI